MSTGEQQQQAASAIRDEVRKTIQQLTEMAQSEKDFDQFCNAVLTQVVKITGAHGALLWQINGNQVPQLTHLSGTAPNETARQITSKDNPQHNKAILEVVDRQIPMGVTSEAFTGTPDATDPSGLKDESFLMLFSPVFSRPKKCCGTLELVQRGDISTKAQEGYLRFMNQISQLFQRWFEQQDLSRLGENADSWGSRMEFISEIHRSIDHDETAFSIANEARRLLNCDRVSVGKWNGRTCKVKAISSQDRFDNRANVIRLLSNVATASVSSESPFWVTGSTDGIAPEVAKRINEYLDESHSRTLAVIPLFAKPPEVPNLEMSSRHKRKPKKLGALIVEYFDADVTEVQIEEDLNLIVKQSEIALENTRKHSEIFMLPVWKRLGWLQKLLFRDHFAKTMTGLAALGILTLAMLFWPKELKMKVDGVMHPTIRQTIFSKTDGIVEEVLVGERADVVAGQPLLKLENQDLKMQIDTTLFELENIDLRISDLGGQLSNPRTDPRNLNDIGMQIRQNESRKKALEKQLELWRLKEEYQTVSSPITGTIVTSELQRRFNEFPIEPNFPLLEVADLKGEWRLELKIDQGEIGYVDEAFRRNDNKPLDVEFKIGTNPNLNLKGTLKKSDVETRAIQSQATGEPVIRAIVQIQPDELKQLKDELRSGAGVTAKILCGKRQLGFVCFYQIIDFFRTKVIF
jgi:multidrug efflux pump subunit AcrA (membrane-fusion protein)